MVSIRPGEFSFRTSETMTASEQLEALIGASGPLTPCDITPDAILIPLLWRLVRACDTYRPEPVRLRPL